MARYTKYNSQPKGLLLCNYKINQGSAVIESVNAFLDHSKYPIFPYSLDGKFDPNFPYSAFDFIIIHYSVIPTLNGYLDKNIKIKLKEFNGPIIQFIQDDYRRTQDMISFIKDIGVDVVYSTVPVETAAKIYAGIEGLKHYTYLTGYASSWLNLEKTVPLSKRKTIVGYRGREYPSWFGKTITIKVDLVKKLDQLLSKKDIKTDISTHEKDRVYGRDWVKFLRGCKAVYGTESDIDFIDSKGTIGHWYDTLESLNKKKDKKKWDGSYVLETDFFKKNAIPAPEGMAVIPPRVLEAICLRAACVLIEGNYSGILKPWIHYIPLKPDLSNLQEVMEALKDDDKIGEIIATAFAEIACAKEFMWEGFADKIDSDFSVILANVIPHKNISLPTIEDLEKIAMGLKYLQNPHVLHVNNPYIDVISPKGLKVLVKGLLRRPWRRFLAIVRKRR